MSLPTRQQSTDDDSKTLNFNETSVIIHGDQSTTTGGVEELLTSKSVSKNPDSNDKNNKLSPILGPTKAANGSSHRREVSVGSLIPTRLLTQAPSLIALLDSTKLPGSSRPGSSRPASSRYNVPPAQSIIPSKSMPDFIAHAGQNTPSLASDANYAFNTHILAPLQDEMDGDSKGKKSRQSQENVFPNGATLLKQQDSDELLMMKLTDDATSAQSALSMDSIVINDVLNKKQEYVDMIPQNGNNEQMVDMQMLAAKAAEEFAVLANENDKLFKENSTLKEQYDDMMHDKIKIEEELDKLKNKEENEDAIIDDIDILKSKAEQWELEKKVLLEQLAEAQQAQQMGRSGKRKNGKGSDSMVGKVGLKLENKTSEDGQRLMMETLAKVTREKNDLENVMEQEKNMKREYEMTISNLKKQLKDNEIDRQILSNNLDKQQKMYLSLKESHKKKELEIDSIVTRTRTLTAEEQEQEEKDKIELLEAVDEQKAYIEQLEAENQKLMAMKVKRDDEMFMELKQLRTHRFAKSIQLDGISNLAPSEYDSNGNHSRGGSASMSNYSTSGMGIYNFHATQQSTADIQFKAIRTQMNLYAGHFDDEMNEEDDELKMINYSIKEDEATTTIDIDAEQLPSVKGNNGSALNTPQAEKDKKKVSFMKTKDPEQEKKEKMEREKEERKRRMMEEKFKVNAEIEFFLLTCIAVKQNLVEEYPMKPEVMTEDAMQLFLLSQKEHVVMSKFNLWIELKLREKYELPKLEGFRKFLDKHGIPEKSKKLQIKSKKLAKKTGQLISAKTEEFAGRIRSISKGGYGTDNEQESEMKTPPEQETIQEGDEKGGDIKIVINGDNGKTDKKEADKDDKEKKTVNGDDNAPPPNNEQCCIIL